jgi:hypothetical protein
VWQSFSVQPAPRRLSAEEAHERQKAERLLGVLDQNEDVALWAETTALGCLRLSYAERYQSLTGVAPVNRHRLREALQRIRAGGGASVQDTIVRINRHTNGSCRGALP